MEFWNKFLKLYLQEDDIFFHNKTSAPKNEKIVTLNLKLKTKAIAFTNISKISENIKLYLKISDHILITD